MITNFETVTNQEFKQLKEAIAYITILVAGADNTIDKEETDWATKLTKIRSYANEDTLHGFYEEVGKDFENDLYRLNDSLSSDVKVRTEEIEAKIAELNPILLKLENEVGSALYSSYVSFAKHVAKASGGFLGFGSISAAEERVLGLKTLDVVAYIEEEDV